MSKFSQKRYRNVGELSSKYAYDRNGEQFQRDLQRHHEEGEALYAEFIEWMKSHDVTPDTFRVMFRKYYEDFIE